MDWIRRRPQTAAAAGVVAVLAVLALVYLMVSSSGGTGGTRTIDDLSDQPTTSSLPTLAPPSASASATPTGKTAEQVKQEAQDRFNQLGQGFSNGGFQSGDLNMPGLQGGSVYQYLPKHRVVMTVTSAAPIGTVGYVVPTSLKQSSGVVRNVGTSWSLTTTAYGDPDYAQLFMQADARGNEITCTIRVDGRVTERQTTQGPYARLICQG